MNSPRPVLVIDFGAQYAQLIARRVREARIYSEVVPHSMPVAEMLAKNPVAIILSGGPSSVYEPGAPTVDVSLFSAGVPTFGICYGFQLQAQALGGTVAKTGLREFGGTPLTITTAGTLFDGLPIAQDVWMSHGDSVSVAPVGFTVTASSAGAVVAGFENLATRSAGVQFHPEVGHTKHGQAVLEHFLYDIAGIEPTWTPASIVEDQVAAIRAQIGDKEVICALSGGVDSAVAAALVHKAVGDQLTCVYVDHGLQRAGESEQVEKDYVAATGIKLKVVDASAQFLGQLEGVTDPEQKRKIIGREFIRTFEQAAREVAAAGDVEFLVQGTLYPDVVESGGGAGTANIKSHHNVGGLPDDLAFSLIEPLRLLFKDEVRQVGTELGLPDAMVHRHPFPGPGSGDPDRRRGLEGPARHPARRRPDRPRRTRRIRAVPRGVAVPGRAARRRTQRRCPGRRPHVRASGRAPAGLQRGRDDGRLVPPPVRADREDVHADHQRGARDQPGCPRRHEQATGHDRVGVML